MHTGRRRGKPRSRILYWFRTPPGVRVGRSALDEDAIRLIEQHNPDVEFDWTRILKGQDAPPDPTPNSPPERRTRPRPRDFPPAAPRPSVRAAEPFAAPPTPEPIVVEPSPFELERSTPPEATEDVPALDADAGVPPEGFAPDGPRVDEPGSEPTAAQARLGYEGLSRLRARHAEVLARISEKVTDAARRDELKSDAERLNPDTWVTDDEVTAGLESYETVFESLRGVIGRRRKRRGRPGGPPDEPASPGTPAGGTAGTSEPGEDV